MSAVINIIETTTELGVEVVEVVVASSSTPGPAGAGVPTGGTTGQRLAKASDTDFDTEWTDAGTPGLHASSHEDGGADEISLTGLSGTPAALTTHEADTTNVHGIADTSALETTTGAQTKVDTHVNDATAAHAATAIAFTPDGSIAATTVQAAIVEVRDEAGGGGAPTDADYLVGTANGSLSAEIVVGTSPGGELGGTWASPTVDATHSGSSHAAVQAAAEATAAAALSAHEADTTSIHGIADTSALALTANHPSNATFNDHSARHEDGGADEISIAGLAGIPTELQTHLDDTTDAHDAGAISVLDAAGDYTATDVEGVLAEIAPQLGGGSGTPLDGWVDDTANTWTRTADQTFTVSGDRTVVFSKGTRLKWTQTTVKYGVVVNSSHAAGTTTVTIATTTDYVLTAAAISLNYYSYMANPQGYPTWFNYTPALTASSVNPNTGTNPSFVGRFEIMGMRATVFAKITFGTGGSVAAGSGTYRVSLPFTVAATQASIQGGLGTFEDSSAGDEFAFTAYGIANQAYAQLYEAQTATTGFLTEANPVVPAASDVIALTIVVEI